MDPQPDQPSPTVVEVLAGVIRDQAAHFERVLATVADISKYAIQPPVTPGQVVAAAGYDPMAGAPYLEMLADDAADPNEVWLGADFLREESAIYDEGDPNPYGLPGIVSDAP